MDPVTFETVNHNPDMLDALMRQARCERAEAVHRLIVLPLKRLFGARLAITARTPCAARSY